MKNGKVPIIPLYLAGSARRLLEKGGESWLPVTTGA